MQNWDANAIIQAIPKAKEQGFDACLIGPVQKLKEDGYKEWWMSYQPTGFQIGNIYLSKTDIQNICQIAHSYLLDTHIDCIINHTGSKENDALTPHPNVDPRLLKNPEYWKEKKNVSNWEDRKDVITHCMNVPGLNVYHPEVQKMISEFLNELVDLGVMGFRFDAAKSIGLPSEGYTFWPDLIYSLKKWGLYLYGEVIFEKSQNVLAEYAKYINVLGSYVNENPNRSVLFSESHDSFLSEDALGYTKNKSSEEIMKEYCALVRNHENTLFYIRPFDETWKNPQIKKAHENALKRVRKIA